MLTRPLPIANRLLTALPRAEYDHLLPKLELVSLTFGEILCEPGDQIKYVFFPNDSHVSLLTLVETDFALEVGLVGREGMVGIELALGIGVSSIRALVQGTGTAMRMKATVFRREFNQSPALQRAAHLYTNALMNQIAQTAACNRFHVFEARLARWLLMTRDRVGSNHSRLTHEFLGHMLGVRRVGVTKAAKILKQRNLIDYSRGYISIIDQRGLEAAACSCYDKLKDRHGKT